MLERQGSTVSGIDESSIHLQITHYPYFCIDGCVLFAGIQMLMNVQTRLIHVI